MTLERIRAYQPRDLEELVRLHKAQGFDYKLPDLNDELFVVKVVATDEADKPVMAALLRLTAEAYLLDDPQAGTPEERWRRWVWMDEAMQIAAKRAGLASLECPVPAGAPEEFCRQLEALGGWRENPWRGLVYKLR